MTNVVDIQKLPSHVSQAQIDELTKVYSDFFNHVNVIGSDQVLSSVFSDVLMKEHNTIQQSFFRMMKDVMEHYGKYAYVDGRNQASREFCNDATDATKDIYLPFI